MKRLVQGALIVLLGALVAPAARAQAADAVEMAAQLSETAEQASLVQKGAPFCSSSYCIGLVPDLIDRYLIFGPTSGQVWFVPKGVMKDAMTAAGCTETYWLYAFEENRYLWVNQLNVAEAMGTSVHIQFWPRPSDPAKCEIRWVYRFTYSY